MGSSRVIPRTGDSPKRAAGYVRVSQVGGREGDSFLSPDVQREKIEAWASYKDYRLVEWYLDLDRPAKERDVRPEFERMMADAKAGRFEAVAVYRLTRFARSVSQAASRYAELRDAGVDLVSVTEDFDTSTSSGRLVQNMLFALAEFESQRIGEEWRNVHASRRRRGIAHVARPMLGYRIDGAEIVGVETAEAPAVRLMFDRRLRGDSYGEIRKALSREGFRPKMGGTMFGTSSIKDVLDNPVYAGLVRFDGELIPGTHPALVTPEQFEAVQAMRRRTNTMARFRGSLLSGLVVCSGCGYRMKYERREGRAPIYRCVATRQRAEPCERSTSIVAPKLDDYVEDRFLRRFDPKRMPHGGKVKATRQQKAWLSKAAKLRARATDLTRALDTLADQRYVKGSMSESEYHRQFERYALERTEAEAEADELESMARRVRPLESDVLALWPRLDVEVRRKALRLMIEQVTIRPAESLGGARTRGIDFGQRVEIAWTG